MPVTRKKPSPLWEEVYDMSDKTNVTELIDEYVKLQRIKHAPDRDKEIDYQIAVVKAKLDAFGIVTEKLDIN